MGDVLFLSFLSVTRFLWAASSYILDGNSSKLCILLYGHSRICILLQQCDQINFEGMIAIDDLFHLRNIDERLEGGGGGVVVGRMVETFILFLCQK